MGRYRCWWRCVVQHLLAHISANCSTFRLSLALVRPIADLLLTRYVLIVRSVPSYPAPDRIQLLISSSFVLTAAIESGQERDTTAPFPNCELEKLGQLLFDKYERLADSEPDLANFMLLQSVKFMPRLSTKMWGGDALQTVRDLIASADITQVAACTTPGSSVAQCVAATTPVDVAAGVGSAEAAAAWNASAYSLLSTFEDLGEHPQSPRGPHWATPQSLNAWGFGDYKDRHAQIGGGGGM